jgi:asparagine synthase (glutamine-hydrolysing)
MCGISGIWRWAESGFPGSALRAAVRAQRHRGPQGHGYAVWADTNAEPKLWRGSNDLASPVWPEPLSLGLGHNWLAIQDPSDAARQPMVDAQGRYCLMLNGEIYNFLELKAELVQQGERFFTASDTEVLLSLWRRGGPACLERLRGMFAFIVFDRVEQTLWAARDRFGMKPLYFALLADGAGLVLASEIRAIHASGLVQRSLSESAASAFLACGVNKPSDSATLFSGVCELPPGELLKVRVGEIVSKRYYRVAPPNPKPLTAAEAIPELRSRFLEVVAMHSRSARRVALSLSGGLDSTNIAFAIRSLAACEPGEISAFSFGQEGSPDLALAKVAARSLGLRHVVISPSSAPSLETLVDLINACELPNHTWGPINQYRLMQYIRERGGESVLLSGQGGDEILSGYPWFFETVLRSHVVDAAGRERLRQGFRAYPPLPPAVLATACQMYRSPAAWLSAYSDGALAVLDESSDDVLAREPVRYYLNGDLEWAELREHTLYRRELQHLLRQEDRLGMWFSIESRAPFLDHELVEFVGQLPPSLLFAGGALKYPLRVMFPEMPAEIRFSRAKFGFWENPSTPSPAVFTQMRDACLDSGTLTPWLRNRSAVGGLGAFSLWRFFQIAVLGAT